LRRVEESLGGTVSIDTAEDFFSAIPDDLHVQRLARCRGSVRFDIVGSRGTDSWRVDINKGDIVVTRDDAPADAVAYADKAVIDGIIRGEVNAVAATLRGVLVVEGNWDLLLLCQRLFNESSLRAEQDVADAKTDSGAAT
jgi:putative sterol carrier protein